MWLERTRISPLRYLARVFPSWILVNTLVCAAIGLLMLDSKPFRSWVFNQIVGLSIEGSIFLLVYILRVRGFWIPALVGVCVCLATGKATAQLLAWPPPWLGTFVEWRPTLGIVGLAITIVPATLYFFYHRDRMAELKAAREEAESRWIHQENLTLMSNLQTLQAQVEPRLLFNTLAHLHTLIQSDPVRARSLLERLNDYLRASLDHSRSVASTLWEECQLLGTYLDIQALRMGNRLSWRLEVPEELRTHPLPPMLLQPLVENAVIHGVEPKIGPVRIEISATKTDGRLHLAVCDNGVGFSGASQGNGLNNVRERLQALFGPEAEMHVRTGWNGHGGVRAELWIPLPREGVQPVCSTCHSSHQGGPPP